MNRLIELILEAARGARVCIIGSDMPSTMVPVSFGGIYFRNHSPSLLPVVRVDIVWFVDPPPTDVENHGLWMVELSEKNPSILRGYPDAT